MSKHLYISGPMTGHEDFNRPAFHEAARLLRQAGYKVTNPAEKGLPDSAPWQTHMRADIKAMMDCDGLAILPGWQHSRGANAEINLANALGLNVHGVIVWLAAAKQPKQAEAAPHITTLHNRPSTHQGPENADQSPSHRRPNGRSNGAYNGPESNSRTESGWLGNGIPAASAHSTCGTGATDLHLCAQGLDAGADQHGAAGKIPQPEPGKPEQISAPHALGLDVLGVDVGLAAPKQTEATPC